MLAVVLVVAVLVVVLLMFIYLDNRIPSCATSPPAPPPVATFVIATEAAWLTVPFLSPFLPLWVLLLAGTDVNDDDDDMAVVVADGVGAVVVEVLEGLTFNRSRSNDNDDAAAADVAGVLVVVAAEAGAVDEGGCDVVDVVPLPPRTAAAVLVLALVGKVLVFPAPFVALVPLVTAVVPDRDD